MSVNVSFSFQSKFYDFSYKLTHKTMYYPKILTKPEVKIVSIETNKIHFVSDFLIVKTEGNIFSDISHPTIENDMCEGET